MAIGPDRLVDRGRDAGGAVFHLDYPQDDSAVGLWAIETGVADDSGLYRQCGGVDGYSASLWVGFSGVGGVCAIRAGLFAAWESRPADVGGVHNLGFVLDGQSLLGGSDNYHRLGSVLPIYGPSLAYPGFGDSLVPE